MRYIPRGRLWSVGDMHPVAGRLPDGCPAKDHHEAIRLADHLALVGDESSWIVGPAQDVAAGDEYEAVLLEIAPRVVLVDAMQRAGLRAPRTRLRRVIDQQQDAARLHDTRDLGEHRVGIYLRPGPAIRLPVEVVIDLDEENRIERVGGETEELYVDGAVLDVRQPLAEETCLPLVVAPLIVGGVVEKIDVSFRPDDVAQELAVVTVCSEEVGDQHPGTNPRETQDFRRMIELVALEVSGRASRMCDCLAVTIGTGEWSMRGGGNQGQCECGVAPRPRAQGEHGGSSLSSNSYPARAPNPRCR